MCGPHLPHLREKLGAGAPSPLTSGCHALGVGDGEHVSQPSLPGLMWVFSWLPDV